MRSAADEWFNDSCAGRRERLSCVHFATEFLRINENRSTDAHVTCASAPVFVLAFSPAHNILCPAKKNLRFSAKFSAAPPLSLLGRCGIMTENDFFCEAPK